MSKRAKPSCVSAVIGDELAKGLPESLEAAHCGTIIFAHGSALEQAVVLVFSFCSKEMIDQVSCTEPELH